MLQKLLKQWQSGDWDSLSEIDTEAISDDPERASIAVLLASAHLQAGDTREARRLVGVARDWGADNRSIFRVLLSTVHNTLARAATAVGREQAAAAHFQQAVSLLGLNATDNGLVAARAVRETARLGLLPDAMGLIDKQFADMKGQYRRDEARMAILETELTLLRQELSLAQRRKQLPSQSHRSPSEGHTAAADPNSPAWREALEQSSVSQLGQDLWVLERCGYKRGGFFVEFGATDGVMLSNTWLLEKHFDWHGICAEPNPQFFSELQQNRTCMVSDEFISRTTGEQHEFILSDAYGGSSDYAGDDQHSQKRAAYKAAGHVQTVTSISLHDFLVEHDAPRDIDYISIDTEGSEYHILSGFPFDEWNVKLFTIEHNFTERRQDIRSLLESNGYVCTEAKWDDWFEKAG